MIDAVIVCTASILTGSVDVPPPAPDVVPLPPSPHPVPPPGPDVEPPPEIIDPVLPGEQPPVQDPIYPQPMATQSSSRALHPR